MIPQVPDLSQIETKESQSETIQSHIETKESQTETEKSLCDNPYSGDIYSGDKGSVDSYSGDVCSEPTNEGIEVYKSREARSIAFNLPSI